MCSFTFVSLGRSHFRNVKDSSLSEFLKGCVSPFDLMGPPPAVWSVCPGQKSYSGQRFTGKDTPPSRTTTSNTYSVIIRRSSRLEKNLCFKLHEDKFVSCPRVFYIQTGGLGQKGGGFSCKMADYHLSTTDNQLLWKRAEVFADADGRCYPSSPS